MLLSLAILVGVSIFAYQSYQRATALLVVERDRQATNLAALRLHEELSKFSEELVRLARHQEMYQGTREQQRDELREGRNRLTVFDGGVVLLDNFGRVRATEPQRPEIVGSDWSTRDFFRNQLTSPSVYFSDATNDGPEGSSVVVVSVPILGEDNEFVGVLAGMFRLGRSRVSSFYAGIVRLRSDERGNSYVIDSNGVILYDSRFSRVGQTVDVLGPAGLRPDRGAAQTQNAQGQNIVVAYAPVQNTSWSLVGEYNWTPSTDRDHRLARTLLILLGLGMALPALGVVLLVREQDSELVTKEQLAHDKQVTALIQQKLLPKYPPMMPGWNLAVHYQAAETSQGDFYDFCILPDGRLMLAVGCIAEKGLAAAHLMATAKAALRGGAHLLLSPAETLAYANELICPEVQPDMCVTCIYAVLDPSNGRLVYANAGFTAPLFKNNGSIEDLQKMGPPLGEALSSVFEQVELTVMPDAWIVFYSDGLLKARSSRGQMLSLQRLKAMLLRQQGNGDEVIDGLLAQVQEFAGKDSLQADDVTILLVDRRSDSSKDGAHA